MYTYEMYIKKENGLNPLNGSSGTVEFAKKAEQDLNGHSITETYAKKSLYDDDRINIGRKENTLSGWNSVALGSETTANSYCSYAEGIMTVSTHSCSHAEGERTTASGGNSHAEGYNTEASAYCSHAKGYRTTASGDYSYAEGYRTTASGSGSHAEGEFSCSIGDYSHAEGRYTTATGNYSHAEGLSTIANNDYSHACGFYNVEMTSDKTSGIEKGTAFVVGNGVDIDIRSNAFSVMFDGKVKAASTITASTTADYAEFFEWKDANPNIEDRVGKFVTLHGDKIDIAKSNKDYILGIVSGSPFVLGNGDCDTWTGMWLRDDFNRIIYEPAPKIEFDEKTGAMKEVFDEDGNLVYEGKRRKLNPNYDPSQKYISRFDRPEWAPVGMLGVLSVIQDGTCEVDGYCCCNKDGIATSCDRNTIGAYRVIKKFSDKVVRVVFR